LKRKRPEIKTFAVNYLMKTKKTLFLILLFLSASYLAGEGELPSIPPAIDGLDRGVIAYLPFEDDARPRFALGQESVKTEEKVFTEGKAGRGILVEKDGVKLSLPGNFKPGVGTIAFWTKPAWGPKDEGYKYLLSVTNANFRLVSEPKYNGVIFFMTGKTKTGVGFRFDYGVEGRIRNWQPGEWHHIALSWDVKSGKKTFYFDGKMVSSGQTEWIAGGDIAPMGQFIGLGIIKAPGVYDEWLIWERILTEEEVACLAEHPSEVNKRLTAVLPVKVMEEKIPLQFGLKAIKNPAETIVSPGEVFISVVPVENTGRENYEGRATFSLLDFWEQTRAKKEEDVVLKPGEKKELNIPFTAPECGVFKVAVSIRYGDKLLEKDVACFAAWPEPEGPPAPNSFFGNHVNAFSKTIVEQAARLGLGWMRDHDMLQTTWWLRVQPEPGEFQWKYDFQMDNLKKYKMPVLGTFFGTPWWAGKEGPLPEPEPLHKYPSGRVPDLNLFRKYVFETVSRYKNYIHHWEVWNEPEVSMFWHGSPEEFARLVKTAYLAAKEADPSCEVIAWGSSQSAFRWHEIAAKAKLLKYVDAISIHYFGMRPEPEEDYEELEFIIEHFNKLSIEYGPGHKLPVWSTEGGQWSTTWLRGMDYPDLPDEKFRSPMNWRNAAISVVQSSAVLQSLGIVRHFYYLHNLVGQGVYAYANTSMVEVTGAPKPILIARVVMASQVDGTRFIDHIRKDEGRFWASVYQKPEKKGTVVLSWAGEKGRIKLATRWPGRIIKKVDIMGNSRKIVRPVEIDEEPCYLHIEAPSEDVIRALKEAKITIVKEPVALQKITLKEEEKPRVPVLPGYAAPGEDLNRVFFVDLRPFCNMGFADEKMGDRQGGWADEGPLNDMRAFPTGKQTFYGVPFHIIDPSSNNGKSIITLRGNNVTPFHPEKVEGIRVDSRVRNLYFLHSASWGLPGEIGRYVINYKDGKHTKKIPIVIPVNNHNWWDGYKKGEESRPVPVRVTNTIDGKPAWRYLRVWEWQNPWPDIPVEGIDFISFCGSQTPILIAITGTKR
jgi:hypothetical protein